MERKLLVNQVNTVWKAVQLRLATHCQESSSKSLATLLKLIAVQVILFRNRHIISANHQHSIKKLLALILQGLRRSVPVQQVTPGMVNHVQHVQLLMMEQTMQCLKLVTNVMLFMNLMLFLASQVQHPFLAYATEQKILISLMVLKLHLECQGVALILRSAQQPSLLEVYKEEFYQELALLCLSTNAKTALSYRHVMLEAHL